MKDLQTHLISEPLSLVDPFAQSINTGSYPIDSIFVSPQLSDIVRGGWLELGEGYIDHRVLYFDIDMYKFLGKHKNFTTTKKIRRLQCNDPRTVNTSSNSTMCTISSNNLKVRYTRPQPKLNYRPYSVWIISTPN